MPAYDYLIIGGGMAADAAVDGIRQVDADGSIGLVSTDTDPPYNRPPLSKGLWKDGSMDDVWRGTPDKEGVTLHLERRIRGLNLDARRATDDRGTRYTYDRLLIATGGTPRQLDLEDGDDGDDGDGIIYFRTLSDYRRLREASESKRSLAVVGGGFIGAELAAALALQKNAVTMLFPGPAICARLFPADLASYLNDYYREHGVDVRPNSGVEGLERRGKRLVLRVKGGDEVVVEGAVAGLGITPNVALAEAAGLAVEDGIIVDEQLHAGRPEVYAAGDVAAFLNQALHERQRVEHEDNALTMGELAGANMARGRLGQPEEPYDHQPYYYSDLFDLGYEAVGELDARLETVVDWHGEPFKEGVVYYLRNGRVRGVLTWNIFEKLDEARAVIAAPGPWTPGELRGRITA